MNIKKQSANKPVLVTLVDEKYLEQAKQVFAAAHFNAGWQGDYLLLAHHIPESKLRWFREKRINIWHCQKFLRGRNPAEINIIHYSKIFLLKKAIKKWRVAIFLDVDTIIRSSIDELLNVKGFAATKNYHVKFGWYFNHRFPGLNLNAPSFCSGIIAFNTEIIKDNSFAKMINLIKRYERFKKISKDEASFNLFFYGHWQKLSRLYNVFTENFSGSDPWGIKPEKLPGIIIHNNGRKKAWLKTSPYYREWLKNYNMAEDIGVKIPKKAIKLSNRSMSYYSTYLDVRFWIIDKKEVYADKIIQGYFKILNWVNKKNPRMFFLAKRFKAKLKGNR